MIGNKTPVNIVVFGCDNSGKTTLCENLAKHYTENKMQKINMVHSLGPNKTLEQQIEFMKLGLYNTESDINIFDRFPVIEETVCGSVIRKHNNFLSSINGLLGYSYLRFVDLFIFCYPGLDSVVNWGSREQMDGVKENVIQLINGYNQLALDLVENDFRVFEYNFKIKNSFDEICKVVDQIQRTNIGG